MTFEDAKKLMEGRGYEIMWHSADKTSFGCLKFFIDNDFGISAQVNVTNKTVKLIHAIQYSVCTIETGDFSLEHPRFKEQFEAQMISNIRKIIYG